MHFAKSNDDSRKYSEVPGFPMMPPGINFSFTKTLRSSMNIFPLTNPPGWTNFTKYFTIYTRIFANHRSFECIITTKVCKKGSANLSLYPQHREVGWSLSFFMFLSVIDTHQHWVDLSTTKRQIQIPQKGFQFFPSHQKLSNLLVNLWVSY